MGGVRLDEDRLDVSLAHLLGEYRTMSHLRDMVHAMVRQFPALPRLLLV
jgi:hypothetical protein